MASTLSDGHVKRAAAKCDLCVNRSNGPACVESCPTHALSLTLPREIMESKLRLSAEKFLDALQSQKKAAP
jgi:Fe-S-cluster-containing hydrogenase component 2